MRLYEIDEYYYFLIHHEPTLKGDPRFHIYGLFDRFKSKKENVLSSEKLELANYEKGIEYFNGLLNNCTDLKGICKFEIDEDELKFFAMKFGYISLKLPLEILIEELTNALKSEEAKDFYIILKKIFQTLEFTPLEDDSSDFLVVQSPLIPNFTLLIQKIKLRELDFQKIGEIIKKYKLTAIVLIPRKQDSISTELNQKLAYLKISLITPSNFVKIFNIYRHSPISHEAFRYLFKGGLIDSNFIDETLEPVNHSNLLNKAAEIVVFLKKQLGWTYFETLEYEFTKERNYTKKEIQSILNLLTHPLINLILIKKEARRFRKDRELYRAIINFDEIQFRLKNIKKFLGIITQ